MNTGTALCSRTAGTLKFTSVCHLGFVHMRVCACVCMFVRLGACVDACVRMFVFVRAISCKHVCAGVSVCIQYICEHLSKATYPYLHPYLYMIHIHSNYRTSYTW